MTARTRQNSLSKWFFGIVLFLIVLCCSTTKALAATETINATVPASLPIHVSADGTVTTASNAIITNNGSQTIKVSSINIVAEADWTIQSKTAAANADAGEKVIAIGFNDAWAVPGSGNTASVDTTNFAKITATGTVKLAYDAVVPAAKAGGASDDTAATATIIVSVPKQPPTLASGSSWYKSSQNRSTITKITFKDSYVPTGTVDEKWNADVNNTGTIKCYRIGTEIIIAGNGAGSIKANADSSYLFSYATYNSEFRNLSSIVNIYMLDTSTVTSLYRAFYYATRLNALDASKWDTKNVENFSAMFSGCAGLTSLTMNTINTSKATNMASMFRNCSGLTILDLENWNTSKVINLSYMFSGCRNLTTIYVTSKWNVNNATNSSSMFYKCEKLKGDISFNGGYTDKTYARASGGYLTYKTSTMSLKLNIDSSGAVNGYTESTTSVA